MSGSLTVLFTDEQLDELADRIAKRIGAAAATVSVTEAAKMIGRSPKTVSRLAKAGLLRPISGLPRTRFTRDEINRFLNS